MIYKKTSMERLSISAPLSVWQALVNETRHCPVWAVAPFKEIYQSIKEASDEGGDSAE